MSAAPISNAVVATEIPYEDILFTLIIIVAVGTIIYQNIGKLGLPFTVVMLIYGMLLGVLDFLLPQRFATYTDALLKFPPKLLFHIFLPVLIFEGSYAMNTHALREVFWQVVIAAGPGLVLNTIFVAVALGVLYPMWNMWQAALLGSLLSATDPVAVVALLKDLGVDKRLTALVDGEAIMNDGTAIIAFTLCSGAAIAGSLQSSWVEILIACVQLTVVAVIFGTVCGYIQCWLHHRAHSEMVQAGITICFAYGSFYIADVFFQTSGVLTLCFQGIYLSTNLPSLFPGKGGNMVASTWHMIVHLANTVLFSLVGMIMARDVLNNTTLYDVFATIFLYLVVVAARFVMLLVFRPWMNRVSAFQLSNADVVLLVHAGLRGGVALTLCLIVQNDFPFDPKISNNFLQLTSGIVFLTLMINATTANWVITRLGLKSKEQHRLVQMQMGCLFVMNEAELHFRKCQIDPFFRGANWGAIKETLARLENPYAEMKPLPEPDEIVLNILLMRGFKSFTWHQRDENQITEPAVRIVTYCLAHCIRHGTLIVMDQLTPHLAPRFPFGKTIERWVPSPLPLAFLQSRLDDIRRTRENERFDTLLAFLQGLHAVERLFDNFCTSSSELRRVTEWCQGQKSEVQLQLAHFFQENKATTTAVLTRGAMSEIIQHTLKSIAENLHVHKGFALPATEALQSQVESLEPQLHQCQLGEQSLDSLLLHCDLFSTVATSSLDAHSFGELPAALLRSLMDDRQSTRRNFSEGEYIEVQPESFCICVGGTVGAKGLKPARYLGEGCVFCIAPYLSPRTPLVHYVAMGDCSILYVRFTFLRSLESSPEGSFQNIVFQRACRIAVAEVVTPLVCALPRFRNWALASVHRMIEGGEFYVVSSNSTHQQQQQSAAAPLSSLSTSPPPSPQHRPSILLSQSPNDVASTSLTSSIVAVRDSLPSVRLDKVLCFVFGKDQSGFYSDSTAPCFVPPSTKISWCDGTLLYDFERFEEEDSFSAAAKPFMMMSSNSVGLMSAAAPVMDLTVQPQQQPSPRLRHDSMIEMMEKIDADFRTFRAMSPSRTPDRSQSREMSKCRNDVVEWYPAFTNTGIPLLNSLQVEFVRQMDALRRVIRRKTNFLATTALDATDQSLQFLHRFLGLYFPIEMELYQRCITAKKAQSCAPSPAVLSSTPSRRELFLEDCDSDFEERVTLHNAEHYHFTSCVNELSRKRNENCDLCDEDLLKLMVDFVAHHFHQDQELIRSFVIVHIPEMVNVSTYTEAEAILWPKRDN